MKNYKLDVVRYNNEDVIATSACTSHDLFFKKGPFIAIVEEEYHYNADVYEYNASQGKYIKNGTQSNEGVYLPADVTGTYYHSDGISIYECTDPHSHAFESGQEPWD